MLEIEIRRGTAEDASLITDLIKKMVVEMENSGGHSVNHSPRVWASMEADVRANSTRQEYIYLIATHTSPMPTVVGMAAANMESLEDIFMTKPRLHLSAIYTAPNVRHHGVARQLLQHIIKWAKQMNATEVALNVLAANPARPFYQQFGFQPHEISMVMNLESYQTSIT